MQSSSTTKHNEWASDIMIRRVHGLGRVGRSPALPWWRTHRTCWVTRRWQPWNGKYRHTYIRRRIFCSFSIRCFCRHLLASYISCHLSLSIVCPSPLLLFPTLPCPVLPYPTLFCPTSPYPTLPSPCLSFPLHPALTHPYLPPPFHSFKVPHASPLLSPPLLPHPLLSPPPSLLLSSPPTLSSPLRLSATTWWAPLSKHWRCPMKPKKRLKKVYGKPLIIFILFGLVWFDPDWFGVVWFGLVWFGFFFLKIPALLLSLLLISLCSTSLHFFSLSSPPLHPLILLYLIPSFPQFLLLFLHQYLCRPIRSWRHSCGKGHKWLRHPLGRIGRETRGVCVCVCVCACVFDYSINSRIFKCQLDYHIQLILPFLSLRNPLFVKILSIFPALLSPFFVLPWTFFLPLSYTRFIPPFFALIFLILTLLIPHPTGIIFLWESFGYC